MQKVLVNKSVKFQIKIQTVAEKIAKKLYGSTFLAALCRCAILKCILDLIWSGPCTAGSGESAGRDRAGNGQRGGRGQRWQRRGEVPAACWGRGVVVSPVQGRSRHWDSVNASEAGPWERRFTSTVGGSVRRRRAGQVRHMFSQLLLVTWRSGNAWRPINEINLHRAVSVLGWVTSTRGGNHLGM